MNNLQDWQRKALNCIEYFGCFPEGHGWISPEWFTPALMFGPPVLLVLAAVVVGLLETKVMR